MENLVALSKVASVSYSHQTDIAAPAQGGGLEGVDSLKPCSKVKSSMLP